MDDTIIELNFPFKGYNQFWGYVKQPQLTTPIITDCRLTDVSEEKTRGGQRPGKSKIYESGFSNNRPIVKILQIGTTYINPK